MKRCLKYLAGALCLVLFASAVVGCGKKPEPEAENNDLRIYASFYPFYAIAEKLVENVPDTYLHCLVQPQDGCLRDYQLSDWDMTLLARSADLVIIGGRGLESFENALYAMGESGPAVASVLYNKELMPAMIEGTDDVANHWQDDNPHLYMSPEGAILIAESIAAQLSLADPSNADTYMANLEEIEKRLRSIINEIKQTLVCNADKRVILMNETAVYTVETLGLDVELSVARDSGEAYYDFELEKLIGELADCESRVILIEKQAPERFCEALENAGFRLAKLDTMSTMRADRGFEGYLRVLSDNCAAVVEALKAEN